MVENEKIKNFVEILKTSVERLKEKQNITVEEFVKNWEIQNIIEREFERAIHCCIDIGARVISIKNFNSASTYLEIFERLFGNKIIDFDLSNKLKEMVKFRNILIHEYFSISPEEVYKNLQNNLYVFSEFVKNIEKFL